MKVHCHVQKDLLLIPFNLVYIFAPYLLKMFNLLYKPGSTNFVNKYHGHIKFLHRITEFKYIEILPKINKAYLRLLTASVV
jgi:hypothetical protein